MGASGGMEMGRWRWWWEGRGEQAPARWRAPPPGHAGRGEFIPKARRQRQALCKETSTASRSPPLGLRSLSSPAPLPGPPRTASEGGADPACRAALESSNASARALRAQVPTARACSSSSRGRASDERPRGGRSKPLRAARKGKGARPRRPVAALGSTRQRMNSPRSAGAEAGQRAGGWGLSAPPARGHEATPRARTPHRPLVVRRVTLPRWPSGPARARSRAAWGRKAGSRHGAAVYGDDNRPRGPDGRERSWRRGAPPKASSAPVAAARRGRCSSPRAGASWCPARPSISLRPAGARQPWRGPAAHVAPAPRRAQARARWPTPPNGSTQRCSAPPSTRRSPTLLICRQAASSLPGNGWGKATCQMLLPFSPAPLAVTAG